MPILPAGQRRYLFDKELVYLFSYDLALEEEGRLMVPEGVRFSWTPKAPPTAGKPEHESFEKRLVYHVLDENTVEGNDAVTGEVKWFRESALVTHDGTVGAIEGAIAIETFDGAILDSRYEGCLLLGPLGLEHFRLPAEEAQPTGRVNLFTSPRFETAYPKYRWLTERQCAGFGVAEIERGRAIRATFDIYAMK